MLKKKLKVFFWFAIFLGFTPTQDAIARHHQDDMKHFLEPGIPKEHVFLQLAF